MPRLKLKILFFLTFISLLFTFIFYNSHLYSSRHPFLPPSPKISPLNLTPVTFNSKTYHQYLSPDKQFSFYYPKNWQINTTDSFKDSSRLSQILVTDANQKQLPIHWNIGVWQFTTTDDQIAGNLYPGLVTLQQSNIYLSNHQGKEIILHSPSPQSDDQIIYRLFIFRLNQNTISITGKYCHQTNDNQCNQFLSGFNFL